MGGIDGTFGVGEDARLTAFADDFAGYAGECLKLRTRDLRLIPWEFNLVQEVLEAVAAKQMAEMGRVRVIVPKRRRGGVSTYVQGRFYHKCTTVPLVHAFTVAHESRSTHGIFGISKLMQDENELAPPTKYSTRIELDFLNRSNLSLATAGSPEAARSSDITLFHGSEMAFWADADTALTAITACIPDPPAYSEMWLESTGNGYGNLFQRMCTETYGGGAHPYYEQGGYTYAYADPETDWVLVFFPWFCLPDARRDFDLPEQRVDFVRTLQVPVYNKDLGRSDKHPDLKECDKYKLDVEQINWKRWKVKSEYRGDVKGFTQEYPTILDDCFATTGGNRFSKELCDELEKMCVPPIMDGTLVARQDKVIVRRLDNGPFRVWEDPRQDAHYVVTCDPAGGERPHQSDKDNPDYTVMDVFRRDGRYLTQVAQWHGRPDYAEIADECMLIGKLYNKAPIAVLRLNHGFAVLAVLAKENWSGIIRGEDDQPGILENKSTKATMVDFTVQAAKDGYLIIKSIETVSEMRTFVERNRKLGAEDGCKDDRVSSAYAGVQAHGNLPLVGGDSAKGRGRQKSVRASNARLRKKRKEVGDTGVVIVGG